MMTLIISQTHKHTHTKGMNALTQLICTNMSLIFCNITHITESFIYLPYSGQPYIYCLFNFCPQLITITSTTRSF